MKTVFIRSICRMLILCIGAFPFGTYAGMIGADAVLATAQAQGAREAQGARDIVRDFAGRTEVRGQLESYGIDRAAAEARVNAMSDIEVANLARQIDQLPAGGISQWAVIATLAVIGLIWYYWVK